MCLAVPMRVIEVRGDMGVAELWGVRREVGLHLLEDVEVGDYVLVHAGFAIEKVDPGEAERTLEMLSEIAGA
ncbi:MAG TPA: HypC/HybG/HupF family hydrogenase formation chaperone [Candidatus Latescibacteria bacterium]|nr:HypC/HybG/HupF family hydrogenase formation chaperone [Candidatus Latescibacterota bacterium]